MPELDYIDSLVDETYGVKKSDASGDEIDGIISSVYGADAYKRPELDFVTRSAPEPEEETSLLGTVGRGLTTGALGMAKGLGSAARWYGEAVEADRIAGVGKKLSKSMDETIRDISPAGEAFEGTFVENPTVKKAVLYISQAVPSLAVALGVGSMAGPTAAAGTLGLLEGAPQYEEAREAGKSVAEASGAGIASTAGTALLEYLPIAKFLKGFKGGIVSRAGKGFITEGSQEASQQLWQNLVEKYGYNKSKDLAEGIVESFIGGGGSGAIAGPFFKDVDPGDLNRAKKDLENQVIGTANDIAVQQEQSAGPGLGMGLGRPVQEPVIQPIQEPVAPSQRDRVIGAAKSRQRQIDALYEADRITEAKKQRFRGLLDEALGESGVAPEQEAQNIPAEIPAEIGTPVEEMPRDEGEYPGMMAIPPIQPLPPDVSGGQAVMPPAQAVPVQINPEQIQAPVGPTAREIEAKDAEDVRTALDLMANEIRNTTGKERGTQGSEYEHDIGSSNPNWFQNLNALAKKEGRLISGMSRANFFTVLDKVKSQGENSLTEKQSEMFWFMRRAIPEFITQSQDFKAADDLAFMQKKGYEPLGGQRVVAADLNDGDKVIIRGEEYENKGLTSDGDILLQDGIPIKIDPFDEITIDGIKKAPIPKPSDAVRQAVKKVVEDNGWIMDEGEWSPEQGFSMRHPETGSSRSFQRLDEIPEQIADYEATRKRPEVKKEAPPIVPVQPAEPTQEAETPSETTLIKAGKAWIDNQQRPVLDTIKPKGKRNKGKVIVILNKSGKRAKIDETAMIEWPEFKELGREPVPNVLPETPVASSGEGAQTVPGQVSTQVGKAVEPKAEAKEPWEMSRDENFYNESNKKVTLPANIPEGYVDLPRTHYIRFGDLPKDESGNVVASKNWLANKPEKGVSVFPAWRDPKTGKYVIESSTSELDNLLALSGITERPTYAISGKVVGTGADGEPLIKQGVAKAEVVLPDDVVTSEDPWRTVSGKELEKNEIPDWLNSKDRLPKWEHPNKKHREQIKQALSEGKPVPESVLKDYPDLKPELKAEFASFPEVVKNKKQGSGKYEIGEVYWWEHPDPKFKEYSKEVIVAGKEVDGKIPVYSFTKKGIPTAGVPAESAIPELTPKSELSIKETEGGNLKGLERQDWKYGAARWEDEAGRIGFELNAPETSGNPGPYWEAGIRHKGWAQESKKFKTREEAVQWLDDYDLSKIDKAHWGPGEQFFEEMFGEGFRPKVKITPDSELAVKEAIADARKNGMSNEFRSLFGGIDPEVAGTTPEAVSKLAKKLGLKWEKAEAQKAESPKPAEPTAGKVAESTGVLINKKGKPISVYHGTASEETITTFKNKDATWFSGSRVLVANRYDKGKQPIIEANISIKNPLDLSTIKGFDMDFQMDARAIYDVAGLEPPYSAKYKYGGLVYDTINSTDFINAAKKAGYDGIIVKESGNKTYGVFSPEQINIINATPTPSTAGKETLSEAPTTDISAEKGHENLDIRVQKYHDLANENWDNPKKLADYEQRVRAVAMSQTLNRPFGGKLTAEQEVVSAQAAAEADRIKAHIEELSATTDATETLPSGITVDWNKVETKEKDGLKGTYYATYNKDGSFKSWYTKTEIERLRNLKGTEGLNLKQDNYGKQDGITGKETKGKQETLGLVVEDKNQPGMFKAKPEGPMDGWQKHLIKARAYATELGIDHKGKDLEQIVSEIDAKITPKGASGVDVSFNKEKGGIELRFKEKPGLGMMQNLKRNGFRWSSGRKIWWAKDTPGRREFAETLTAKPRPVEVPAPKAATGTGFAPEILVEGKWNRNSLVFATEKEAADWAEKKRSEWMMAEGGRAVPVDEAPKHEFRNGELSELEKPMTSDQFEDWVKKVPKTEPTPDLSTKSTSELVGDIFSIINDHIGKRGSISGEPSLDESLYQKLKPYLAVIVDRAKAKALDVKAYLFGAVDSMPEGKAKDIYEQAANKYIKESLDISGEKDILESQGGTENANISDATEETGSARNDRAGVERPSPGILPRSEAEQGTAPTIPEQPRRPDDAELRGSTQQSSDEDIVGEKTPSGKGARADNGRTPTVGRDSRNVAGVQRSDYRIGNGELTRTGSWRTAAINNLDAIELVKKLEAENRPATEEEKAVLVKYVGWGSSELANNMFPGFKERGEVLPSWLSGKKKDEWGDLVERLTTLLSPEEIKTAARSTQYAHYTSEAIVRSIYNALERFGFTGGKIIEPGMGTGHFLGLLPDNMYPGSKYTGIEMDHITAAIAKALYPNQNILQGDYTKLTFPNAFFDLGVGNPPFAKIKILADPDYKKFGFKLHDYFFAKTLDKVRPGGLLVFITSRYTMDKVDSKVRKYLADRADLVGAIRLPQTAFQKNAGTEVVTDVLFFRKRAEGEQANEIGWQNLKEISTPEGNVNINEYYVDHPEMVLGKNSLKGSMYSSNEYTVLPSDGNIEDHFAEAVKKLPENIYSQTHIAPKEQEAAVIERDFNPLNKKEGGIYLSDKGQLMVVDSGSGVPIKSIDSKLTDKQVDWLKDYVPLRDALKQAQLDQLKNGDWEKSLKALQTAYSKFVKKHGHIMEYTTYYKKETDEDGNETQVEHRKYKNGKLLALDVEGALAGLLEEISENGQIEKGPFLLSRQIKVEPKPDIKNIHDALAVSLDEIGKFDVSHISKLSGIPEEEVVGQLGDLVYEEPGKQGHVIADEYLSGNVLKKLEEAREAAKLDNKYERNVKALEKVQPEQLTAKDITVSPGSNWISTDYYNDFMDEILGVNNYEVKYTEADNKWTVTGVNTNADNYYRRRRSNNAGKKQGLRGNASEWGNEDRGANEIFESVLNNATLKIVRKETIAGVSKTYTDPVATTAVNEIAKNMRRRFSTWVWEDASRANDILTTYNKKFNNLAGRRFDGSHLTLPGISLKFKLHDHQKRAIWRIIQTGNVYLGHSVGAGKTLEMIAAGMEMKRLGLINKPIYIVPNHMLQQFANEFQEAYPLAHVMVADEENFHTTNRRRFVARATLNNPDAIVMTHSSFNIIRMQEENIAPVKEALIGELREALSSLEEDKQANRIRIKQMENRIEQLEQRFDGMVAPKGKDNVVSFEEMGADFLFVDEAHNFRKLDFATNRQAKGIDSQGSQRAIDLYIKTRWLEMQKPGRSHVFASGTPVTNTMAEIYSLMRFFIEDEMKAEGIGAFDSWANMFGVVSQYTEMNAAGRYELVERFSEFVNVPELMSRVRSFMDIITGSQLGAVVTRPEIVGGRPEIVVTPALPELKQYQTDVLLHRIQASKAWKPSPGEKGNPDPIINIITDGRLASIDLRFVVPGSPNNPESKLNKFIDGIIEKYQETQYNEYTDENGNPEKIKGSGVIAFYNHGFGRMVSQKRGFNARDWLMKRLSEAGIPASEVAWIDDYDTAVKKEAMFKAVRNGKKRILLGSAKKMGTGMNVQKRLSALEYLDAPWYPADVEQPDGRILRQGNQNKTVSLRRYATKGSYDATMWQMVANKARMIEQAFIGDRSVRKLADLSEAGQYALASALASGDERAIQLANLKGDRERLESLGHAHEREQLNLKIDKRDKTNIIEYKTKRLKDLRAAEKLIPDYISTIEGKIDGASYDNRTEFGTALISKYNKIASTIEESGKHKVAEINGIPLNVTFHKPADGTPKGIAREFLNIDLTLDIDDNVSFTIENRSFLPSDVSPKGLTDRIVNQINGFSSIISREEDVVGDAKKDLAAINKRLGAPFAYQQELSEKTAEIARLESELVAEGTDASELPSIPTVIDDIQPLPKLEGATTPALKKGEDIIYVRMPDGFEQRVAKKIEIVPWAETYIHNDEEKGWVVTEIKTGLSAGTAPTRESAIEKARTSIEGAGQKGLEDMIARNIEDSGEAPRPNAGNRAFATDEPQYSTTPSTGTAVKLKDVQSFFKNQHVGLSPDGSIWVQTTGGMGLKIFSAESIAPDKIAFEIAYSREMKDGEVITGKYEDGTITLNRHLADTYTLAHESFHWLEVSGILNNAEISAINRSIGKENATAEDRAKWFENTIKDRREQKGILGQAIQKIKDFIGALVNVFHKTALGVVRDVESGKVFERGGQKTLFESTPQYQMAETEQIKQLRKGLTQDSLSTIETLKSYFEKSKPVFGTKQDLSYWKDLIASIPAFYKDNGIPAVKSIYDSSQDRMDEKAELEFDMENVETKNGVVNTVKAMEDLRSSSKDAYDKVKDYIVEIDRQDFGFKLRKDDGEWVIKDRSGSKILFRTGKGNKGELIGIEKLLEYEARDLKERGFTPEQINAIIAVRLTENKGFELLFASMRKLIEDAKIAGFKLPEIPVYRDGKHTTISLKQAMAEMGDMRGSYFPRIRRPGRFIMTAKKDGQYSILEPFNSQILQKPRIKELEKQGYEVFVSKNNQVGEDVFQLAGNLVKTQQIVNAALDRVERARDKEVSEGMIEETEKELRDMFASSIAEQISNIIKERGARVHMTKRSGDTYLGYEEDPLIAIPKYIKGLAGAEAKKNMTVKMLRALTGTETSWNEFKETNENAEYKDYVKHVKEAMIEQGKQPNAFKWAIAYIGENTRNPDFADNVIGWLRGAAVGKYLAFRVFSAPLVNLTALPTSTIATLKGAGISYGRSWKELGRGIQLYGKYLWSRETMTPDEVWIFDYMSKKGWDNAQYSSESLSVLRSSLGKGWDKTIELGMFTFSQSEKLNRAATIAAAFNGLSKLPQNQGKSKEEIAEMAKDVSDNSHGVYNKGNYPYIALGGNPAAHIARMMYVFQRFTHTYLMNMKKLGFEQKDYAALAHMVIAPAIIAGAGASILTPIITTILKAFGFDEPEEEAYREIGKIFGPGSETAARYGVAGLAGFSIKGSLSVGVGAIPTSVKDVLGAPGSVLSDIFIDGIPLIAEGDVEKGFEKILPTGIGNLIRAHRESTEGLTTRTNRPIFYGDKQVKLDSGETFLRALSLYPSRIATIREKQYSEYKSENKYSEQREDIYASIKKYYLSDKRDREKWLEILAEVQAYNESAREVGNVPLITQKSILTNLKRSFKPSKKERMRKE